MRTEEQLVPGRHHKQMSPDNIFALHLLSNQLMPPTIPIPTPTDAIASLTSTSFLFSSVSFLDGSGWDRTIAPSTCLGIQHRVRRRCAPLSPCYHSDAPISRLMPSTCLMLLLCRTPVANLAVPPRLSQSQKMLCQ